MSIYNLLYGQPQPRAGFEDDVVLVIPRDQAHYLAGAIRVLTAGSRDLFADVNLNDLATALWESRPYEREARIEEE